MSTMLVIRNEQMKAFASHRQEKFRQTAAARWQSRSGGRAAEAEVQALVARHIQCAVENYGIDKEGLILRYLDLVQDFGEEFDRQPWATEILKDQDLSAALKIRLLEEGAGGR
jgi:hypothetical protein